MGVTTVVPFEAISHDVLRPLIESFITREGTDYGELERSLVEKVSSVIQQLKRKEVYIVFDGALESVTIITAQEAAPLLHARGFEDADEDAE